ncbi:hypothetical protein [Salinisphaera sp. Q1T1-3]|uniref:hypothetical protein n=1 Tax=Salinisphaera sp. Q1T1-3 TaxID=2321229 RepID=UPI0011C40090|nr:hypothetical protein [Salinisphaera sp. Q1T1-3]
MTISKTASATIRAGAGLAAPGETEADYSSSHLGAADACESIARAFNQSHRAISPDASNVGRGETPLFHAHRRARVPYDCRREEAPA